MNNIILELVKIDTEAKDLLKETIAEKENLQNTIQTNGNEIKAEIEINNELEIEKLKIETEEEKKTKLDEINKSTLEKALAIKGFFKEKESEWLSEITEKIIGGE